MPETETLCLDDLRARATGRIGCRVASARTVAVGRRGIELIVTVEERKPIYTQ
jgi:hypothetical protein